MTLKIQTYFLKRVFSKKKSSIQRFKCMRYNWIDLSGVNTKLVLLLIFARIINFASKAWCTWLDPSLVGERRWGDNNLKTRICIVNKTKLFRMDFPITYQETGLYLFSETVLEVKLIFSFLLQGIRYRRFFLHILNEENVFTLQTFRIRRGYIYFRTEYNFTRNE